MDKELARFILRSYRPDERDANDTRFAEALAMAANDPGLGAWFASERANDTAIAAAIASIELPGHLRREILDALAYERGDLPHTESADDPDWARALATITPPPGLRDSIIAGMNASVARPSAARHWKRYAIPAAAAAAIALALALPANRATSGSSTAADRAPGAGVAAPAADPLPVGMVRAGFLQIYQESGFTLDSGRASHREIMRRLEERGLPCPTCMPPGLRDIEGIGCRELVINGRRGTLVCYEKDGDGIIHLVIFRAEDIHCDLPPRRDAVFTQDGEWASACWRNRENAFVLIGHTEVSNLAGLF